MEAKIICMNDEYMLEGCRKNDRNCQRQLYEKYFRSMSWVCYRYVRDREVADDLVHEGFIKVFRFINSFKKEGSFEGWVKKIMINGCLDYLRKGKRRPDEISVENITEPESSEHDVLAGLQAEYILEKIQELPPIHRAVFNLNVIEGYPHKDIAEMMKFKESTSRAYLTEARQLLRAALKPILSQTERRLYHG
ncbi:MAG: RNA polymerase sigma factor [Bacteroidia bacterium]|nr:RNA polymerase sigma factor [Bacteroidia bacterium]